MKLEPRKFMKNAQVTNNPNILRGFKLVQTLADTDYSKIIIETNKPEKLDTYIPSLYTNKLLGRIW
jgi:hypothetical protein